MSKIWIGIDPGKKGAIAHISDHEVCVYPMMLTVYDRLNGKGILNLLTNIVRSFEESFCLIEKSQAVRGQGIVSAFNYGVSYGIILACVQSSNIPFQEISSMRWKKEFNLLKKEKEDSVNTAIQLFPNITDRLRRPNKKDPSKFVIEDGSAEALLISEYARRKM